MRELGQALDTLNNPLLKCDMGADLVVLIDMKNQLASQTCLNLNFEITLQLVFGCTFPTQFFPLHKMFFFPPLQKDILQPAHILVAHLS